MQLVLAVVESYMLRYVATTQRAVLQSVAAHLTTANMTTGQEDDLRLEREDNHLRGGSHTDVSFFHETQSEGRGVSLTRLINMNYTTPSAAFYFHR